MSRTTWAALASGVLFGAGLALSQMLNPAKVLAFLDVARDWDPSLALVMAGALAVMAPAWRVHNRARPAVSAVSHDGIDGSLFAGAVLFGVGWGLVGYCPGPAVASLALASPKPVVFVLAMLSGMAVHDRWAARAVASARGAAYETSR